jgi:hypothetical protein
VESPIVPVRIPPTEKQLIELAAREVGIPVSTYLRLEGIKAARRQLLEMGE